MNLIPTQGEDMLCSTYAVSYCAHASLLEQYGMGFKDTNYLRSYIETAFNDYRSKKGLAPVNQAGMTFQEVIIVLGKGIEFKYGEHDLVMTPWEAGDSEHVMPIENEDFHNLCIVLDMFKMPTVLAQIPNSDHEIEVIGSDTCHFVAAVSPVCRQSDGRYIFNILDPRYKSLKSIDSSQILNWTFLHFRVVHKSTQKEFRSRNERYIAKLSKFYQLARRVHEDRAFSDSLRSYQPQTLPESTALQVESKKFY